MNQFSDIAPDTLRRVRLTVQYDGAGFCGWQRQTNGPSVQAALEDALARLFARSGADPLPAPPRVTAAGRTDAGVHALAMPVHFDTAHPIPTQKLPVALAQFLPSGVCVLDAQDAPATFDARRGAILRWYRYQIQTSRLRRPLGPRAWHVHRRLDAAAMQQGIALLRGEHDFRGFRAAECQALRTVLTMQQATLFQAADDLLVIDFKCRSFLHHMVRFMTGSLVALGAGGLTAERLLKIRDEGARPEIASCAPPEGLCLMGVAYTKDEAETILAANPPAPSF